MYAIRHTPKGNEPMLTVETANNQTQLHIALIMRQDHMPENKAMYLVFCEGEDGFEKRLKLHKGH
jgi:uncharacterized membrane protein (UPF0127 family)